MEFTQEQLNYLAKILTPNCCHTSGFHSPTHFADNPTEFCESQKSIAWTQAVKTLNLRGIIPKAISRETCGWCRDGRDKAFFERDFEMLPTLSEFIESCFIFQPINEKDILSGYVFHQDEKFHVQFRPIHRVADVGLCSWFHFASPEYDVKAEIPSDGYPKKRGILSVEEEAKILQIIELFGGKILTHWNHLAVAIEKI